MSGTELDHAARTLGDRYQLLSKIGSGASADVYRATDLRLGRDVAIKQIRSDLTEDIRFVKLFRSEAHLAAQLSHPNILTVFDWSADTEGQDGGAYIVTEMLGGGTLRNVLDSEGVISPAQAAFIGLQAAKGLAFAHEQGLVHRDIKPANLLFGVDGRVYIGDFGIARAVAKAAWTEPEGVLIGTARYAAPEQATPGRIDGQVDVYSLAVCLIEALTGEVPLVRDNAIGTMTCRQSVDLPVDDSFGPLAGPLTMAGRADPEERATAAEVRDALLAVCRQMPDPDPLTLIDLTDAADGPRVRHRPNVRISDTGDLIIEDDEGPDLAIPADEPEKIPLGDETIDSYDTLTHGKAPVRWGRWAAGIITFVALAVGALIGGGRLADARQADLETIAVGLPSYEVPDFTGMDGVEAQAGVLAYNWEVSFTEIFQDDTQPGQLLSQSPAPGAVMGPGNSVELVFSRGPAPRTVPETIGLTEDQAREAIEDAALVVGTIGQQFDETITAGVVLEATIDGVPAQPGAEFLPGVVIDLLVSAGPAPREVPGVEGMTLDQAKAALDERTLVLATADAHSDSVPEGIIISSEPAAGATVVRGSTVTVTVSLGLPFIVVPDVVGRPVTEAIDELQALGFPVAINGTIGSAVIGTRPGAGESVRSGTEIEILSSLE